MASGIYTITVPSGHQYVGSAVSFRLRWNSHLSLLRRGTHSNRALRSAFKKYGERGLKFQAILLCEPKMLLYFEQRAIDVLRPKYNAYRIAGSAFGHKASDATKAKLAKLWTGRKHTPEARARMSATTKGKPRTDAQKAALRMNQAKAKTPEAIAKMADTMRAVWSSPTHRERNSQSRRAYYAANPVTDEWRAKVSATTKAGLARRKARLRHEGK